jgi:Icc-related predicted phosphoesterase
MKILICSDLHTDFHADHGLSLIKGLGDADVIVVAGDISSGASNITTALKMLCTKYENVVFVSGNHEYYNSSFSVIDNLLKDFEQLNSQFHWLNNSRVDINGVSFIGATLWFDYNINIKWLKSFLSDFYLIKGFEQSVYNRFNNTITYFENNIKKDDIVITHHMPSYKCISEKYIDSKINCFFANDLDKLIIDTKPMIWIHGHTHCSQKCLIGDTNIIGNPFGYPNENFMFDDNLIIEV